MLMSQTLTQEHNHDARRVLTLFDSKGFLVKLLKKLAREVSSRFACPFLDSQFWWGLFFHLMVLQCFTA